MLLPADAVVVVLAVLPVALAGAFGAVLASFAAVVGERVPAGRSLGGRSVCRCGAAVGAWNVPIVAFALLRGRARCCGRTLPLRYVMSELGCAVGFAAVWSLQVVVLSRALLCAAVWLLTLAALWQRPGRVD